jgi:hypothetical protein
MFLTTIFNQFLQSINIILDWLQSKLNTLTKFEQIMENSAYVIKGQLFGIILTKISRNYQQNHLSDCFIRRGGKVPFCFVC